MEVTTLETLQETQNALIAKAHATGQLIPGELVIDIDDVDVGIEVCKQLEKLVGQPFDVAEVQEPEQTKPNRKRPKKKQENGKMTTQTKPKKKAAKKSNGSTHGGHARNGVMEKLVALMKKGCTREQALALTGWKALSFQQVAEGQGLKLKVDKKERPFKYKAAA